MKRKIEKVQVSRKLRSTLPRRRRPEISPIILSGEKNKKNLPDFEDSTTASSLLTRDREVSCGSSRVSFNISPANRRITRLYSRRKEIEKRERKAETEVSESSCVDSCSNLTIERNNELSCAEFPGKIAKQSEFLPLAEQNDAVLEHLLCNEVESVYSSENEISCADFPGEIAKPNEITTETEQKDVITELLLCNEVESEYSSAFSDLESEIYGQGSSEVDFSSDYTPSIWLESGSEFSERSVGESSPSPTYSLFLQYSHDFCPSKFSLSSRSCSGDEIEYRAAKMEDDADEMSYAMLRKRERREVYMQDYAEEYCSITDCANLIIQQRLQMVHWIVEQSTSKELQKETMFLGVSLLDRFLSKGFFKNKRNLQVAGIACLSLATRLEENQPYNSVRKKTLCVGTDTYSRCEVVAMEWLIMEVLNFQCFMPTIYNFLWFYLKAAKADKEVEKITKYLAVLALLGHEQLCFWPSTVAAALVILASLSANQDVACNRVVETHVRTKEDDLSSCLKSLEWLVKYAC